MSRLLLLLSFILPLFAQESKEILHFYEPEYDFGEINEMVGKAEHIFKFKNVSDKPVKLFLVKASCGCTTPTWTKEAVLPGKEGEVKVVYNTPGRIGPFSKSITVKYRPVETSEEYEQILIIRGKVKASKPKGPQFIVQLGNIRFTNNHISLGTIYDNEKNKEAKLGMFNTSSEVIYIKEIKAPLHIKIDKQPPVKLAPNDTIYMKISYDATKRDDWGFVYDRLILLTDESAENRTKTITISAYRKQYFPPMNEQELAQAPKLKIDKLVHDFGTVKQGEVLKTTFSISNEGKKTLKILKTKASCGCTIGIPEKKELKGGESTLLRVTFNTAGRVGKQHKTIRIFSNDPKNPETVLTIKAIVQ